MAPSIRVLIIGVGSIGERHLRCFRATDRVHLSLCEINDALRTKISRQYEVDDTYESLEAALNFPPDVAVVATPAHLHVEMACQLGDAGVHLLIEKPLSVSTEHIDALQTIVDRRNLTAGVAYVYRSHPALQAMKQALDSGRFGKPLHMTVVSGSHFPTFRPAYRDTYYRDHDTGGGAIQDALTHLINAGQWLVGPVDRLVADAAHQVLEGVRVEDTANVLARHGEVLGCYSLNQYQAPAESFMRIVAEHGTMHFEMHNHCWSWMLGPQDNWHSEQCDIKERDDLFIRQAHDFLDAVESGTTPSCTLREGVHTLLCNLAALRSVEDGTWQEVT